MVGFGDIVTIATDVLGGLKSAADTVKVIKEVRSVPQPKAQQIVDASVETLGDQLTEVRKKYLEVQEFALTTKEAYLALQQKYEAAIMENTQLKQFDTDREKFERVALALNTFAYREKAVGEAKHGAPLLCPNCFEARKKTYLSFNQHAARSDEMKCTACGTGVHVARDDGPAVMVGRVKRGWEFFDDI